MLSDVIVAGLIAEKARKSTANRREARGNRAHLPSGWSSIYSKEKISQISSHESLDHRRGGSYW